MENKSGAMMMINPRHSYLKRDKEEAISHIKALGNRIKCESSFRSHGNSGYLTANGIAIVPCSGPMMKGGGYRGYADQSELASIMQSLASDSSIKGCLKIFDTPGGSVAGTADYGDSIAAFTASKPCIGYAQDMCCSAGMWAASQCSKLFSNSSAMIGSIGVISWLTDATKMYEEAGIKDIPIMTGKYKAAGDPSQPATPEIVDYMQSTIDDLYDQFLSAVNKGRGIPKANIKSMEAAVFVGEKAVKNGLIDGICSIDDAYNMVSKMANRSTKNARAMMEELDIDLQLIEQF